MFEKPVHEFTAEVGVEKWAVIATVDRPEFRAAMILASFGDHAADGLRSGDSVDEIQAADVLESAITPVVLRPDLEGLLCAGLAEEEGNDATAVECDHIVIGPMDLQDVDGFAGNAIRGIVEGRTGETGDR